ncbi:MAG TPA: hypothetical protein VGV59_03295, partial [Pyrinomonadaceae bacterium]|nr:hypothetical protein [Pyrinomonadaceae bacterium]
RGEALALLRAAAAVSASRDKRQARASTLAKPADDNDAPLEMFYVGYICGGALASPLLLDYP